MSDNLANPVKGAETDLQTAAKSIAGLLNTNTNQVVQKDQPQQNKQELKNSPEPKKEELQNNQPLEQGTMEAETEVQTSDETSEEVSQDKNSEILKEQDSTYKVKVAGQEFDVTLDELRAGYSRDADYRRKTEDLAYERKNFQAETEKQRQDYSSKLNELNQLMSLAQQQLTSEFKNIDLEKLYEQDPTEAARIEHKLRKKQDQLSEMYQKTKAEQDKQLQDIISDQTKKLESKLPEFSDPDKASKLKSDMRSYLQSYGFKDQEIGSIYDHRIVMLVNDAMKYRSFEKAKSNLASKIAKPSKVLSSGVKQTKTEIDFQKRKEKLGRLKKSGSIKDATSIFLDMINKQK